MSNIAVLPAHSSSYYQDLICSSEYDFQNKYTIRYFSAIEAYTCTCPSFQYRCRKSNEMCKHIEKVKVLDDNNAPYGDFKKYGITINQSKKENKHDDQVGVNDTTHLIDSNDTAFESKCMKELVNATQGILNCIDLMVKELDKTKI